MGFKFIKLTFIILITYGCPLSTFQNLNRPIVIINSTSTTYNENKSSDDLYDTNSYSSGLNFEPSRVQDFD